MGLAAFNLYTEENIAYPEIENFAQGNYGIINWIYQCASTNVLDAEGNLETLVPAWSNENCNYRIQAEITPHLTSKDIVTSDSFFSEEDAKNIFSILKNEGEVTIQSGKDKKAVIIRLKVMERE